MAPCPPGATGARRHEGRRRDGEPRGHGPPLVTGEAPQPVPPAAHVHGGELRHLADRRRVHTGRTYRICARRPYEIRVQRAYKRSVLCHGTTTCDERSACDPTMGLRGGARRRRWTTDELWTTPSPEREVPRRGNARQRPAVPIGARQYPSARTERPSRPSSRQLEARIHAAQRLRAQTVPRPVPRQGRHRVVQHVPQPVHVRREHLQHVVVRDALMRPPRPRRGR